MLNVRHIYDFSPKNYQLTRTDYESIKTIEDLKKSIYTFQENTRTEKPLFIYNPKMVDDDHFEAKRKAVKIRLIKIFRLQI